VSNDVNTKGYGIHSMGGVPWGNHPSCPGGVREAQRAAIIALAKEIRHPATVTPPPTPPPPPAPKPPVPVPPPPVAKVTDAEAEAALALLGKYVAERR